MEHKKIKSAPAHQKGKEEGYGIEKKEEISLELNLEQKEKDKPKCKKIKLI